MEPFWHREAYEDDEHMNPDDLIRLARQGDRRAYGDLIGPLTVPAYRLAFGILQDREAAEDTVQEAALRAWRKFANLRPDTDFRPWFFAIVANQSRKAARRRWRILDQFLGFGRTASAEFEDRVARGADIRAALRRLSFEQREALVLRYYLDLPLHEVAAITGVPIGTVKSRLNRGLAAMRIQFEALEVLM